MSKNGFQFPVPGFQHDGWKLAAGDWKLPTEYPANGSFLFPRALHAGFALFLLSKKEINGQASRLISIG
jgi:hypothetical protein